MIDVAIIQPLLPVFKAQGLEHVYVVSCCGRVYLGAHEAKTCRTCQRTPKNYVVRTDGTDLQSLVQE